MKVKINCEGFVSYRGKLYTAGTELELPTEEGNSLIQRGLAVAVGAGAAKAKTVETVESDEVSLPPVDLEKNVTSRKRTTKKG